MTDWGIWDVFWVMFMFFMWFLYAWMVITTGLDIFRRRDLGGGAKAGWLIFLIFAPLLGMLVYMIARPKDLPQDKEILEQMRAAEQKARGISPAEEIAKAHALKESGAISEEEFQKLKARALA